MEYLDLGDSNTIVLWRYSVINLHIAAIFPRKQNHMFCVNMRCYEG